MTLSGAGNLEKTHNSVIVKSCWLQKFSNTIPCTFSDSNKKNVVFSKPWKAIVSQYSPGSTTTCDPPDTIELLLNASHPTLMSILSRAAGSCVIGKWRTQLSSEDRTRQINVLNISCLTWVLGNEPCSTSFLVMNIPYKNCRFPLQARLGKILC